MMRSLLLLLTLCMGFSALGADTSLDKAKITAPDKFAEHEPIVLDLEGVGTDVPATFWWRPFGRGGVREPGYKLYNGNQTMAIWAAPGTYDVVCLITAFDVQWEQKTFRPFQREVKVTFTVVDSDAPTPPPTPPAPPGPSPDQFGMTKIAYELGMKVDPKYRGLAKSLADNFDSMDAAIAAGAYSSIQAANTELAGRNRNVLGRDGDHRVEAWRSFFSSWQQAVDALNKAGKATTLEDYRVLYRETAAGLREVK